MTNEKAVLEQRLNIIQKSNSLLKLKFLAEDVLFLLAFLANKEVPLDLLSAYYVYSKPNLLLQEPMITERVIDELIHAELISMEAPSMILLSTSLAETLRTRYYEQIQRLPGLSRVETATQFFSSIMTVLLNKLSDCLEYDLSEMSIIVAMHCHLQCTAQFVRNDPYYDRNNARILKIMSETADLLSKLDLSPV